MVSPLFTVVLTQARLQVGRLISFKNPLVLFSASTHFPVATESGDTVSLEQWISAGLKDPVLRYFSLSSLT